MYTKTTFAILLLVISLPAAAQLKKGQWLVGGIGAFSHSTSDDVTSAGLESNSKATTVGLSVNAAYFFADRFCGGLRPAISTSDTKQEVGGMFTGSSLYFSSQTKATIYAISPFVRYYFLPNGNKINIIADLSYSYSYNKQKSEVYQTVIPFPNPTPTISYSKSETEAKASIYTIAAGPAIFLSSDVSLELTVGYSHRDFWDSEASGGAVQIATGFQYHFGRKK